MNKIIHTDALSGLAAMDPESVHCCVTSPPYWLVREYGTVPVRWPAVEYSVLGCPLKVEEMSCELGQEPSHFAYVGHLVEIFRGVKRALRDDGTAWINIGDSYAAGPKNRTPEQTVKNSTIHTPHPVGLKQANKVVGGLKNKDLAGIPGMLAMALRDDGWYWRCDIIWAKPNGMPESVEDRPTKSHEYILLMSKSERYYYDFAAIRTQAKDSTIARASQNVEAQTGSPVPGKTNGMMKTVLKGMTDKQRGHSKRHAGFNDRWDKMSVEEQRSFGANKRSVWTVPPANYPEGHFAVYPEDLVVDMIKAGCPEGGVVLDPFAGRGTTAAVARKLGRNFVSFELQEEYLKLSEKYLYQELGVFQ